MSARTSPRSRRRRPLGPRQIRSRVWIGQEWTDMADGAVYRIKQIHRKDRQVQLETELPNGRLRHQITTFTELGSRFDLKTAL